MKKLLLFLSVITFISCQKNNAPVPASTLPKLSAADLAKLACIKKPPVSHGIDVYVTGTYAPFPGANTAAYWKNGVQVDLLPEDGSASDAFGIAVSGTNVYVAGSYAGPAGSFQAVYWKNGVMHTLNNGPEPVFESEAFDVSVSGNDVYVVGEHTDSTGVSSAMLWKNGTPHKLAYNAFNSSAISVVAKGADVYVVGSSAINDKIGFIATYWKNGVPTRLPNHKIWTEGKDIAVNGNDVYIAGISYPQPGGIQSAVYWKNGTEKTLQANALAEGIAVGNNAVYVGGTSIIDDSHFRPAEWKNSNQTLFGSSGVFFGKDIATSGNDVYLLASGSGGADYYKNGVATHIAGANPSKILVVQY